MKRFVSFVLALLMCLSLSVFAFADVSENIDPLYKTEGSSEPSRSEETVWIFRTLNGINQMRLWSITYRKWLGDWIDIGPA